MSTKPIQVCSATRNRLTTVRRIIRRPVTDIVVYVQKRRLGQSPN